MASKGSGKSGPKSASKKKPSAKAHATRRLEERPGTGEARVPQSIKKISQDRFPGETPLTGEDRPAEGTGGKKKGQNTAATGTRRRGTTAK